MALLASAAQAADIPRAIDGDTITVRESADTPACHRRRADGMERIRVLPHDAPELDHARCPAERVAAEIARDRLQQLLAAGLVVIRRDGCDAYRRTRATALVDGRDVAAVMLAEGVVLPYRPRQAQERPGPWCR